MITTIDTATALLLRSRLLELARRHDELANEEAVATPYWTPQPTSVHTHRTVADALRADADLFLAAEYPRMGDASMDTLGRAS
ncbi:hypothetical protein [Nocardioides speluncae]|uniref:hypothetical protein n=1 Tax=Nocardioides speluncae TaxID=2670337 RepID=UPI000D6894CD|nr:hypothetical protein [Nocardioides speluncae]